MSRIKNSVAELYLDQTKESSLIEAVEPVNDKADSFDPGDFPIDALSPVMRQIAIEHAEVHKIPVCMTAMTALAVGSGAMGKTFNLTHAVNGKSSFPNIMVVIAAERGVGKGVCSQIAKPLWDASCQLAEEFKVEQAKRRAKVESLNTQKKSLLKKVGTYRSDKQYNPEDPLVQIERELVELQGSDRSPSYIEGNATSEALTDTLLASKHTIFSSSPEAGALVRVALGEYKNFGDFDLLLSGYSSEPVTISRRSRGQVNLEPTISSLWFVQPYILHELISNSEAFERGLTARILIFDAKAEPEEDDGNEQQISAETQIAWENTINSILTKRENSSDPHTVQCSNEAREVFREFHNEIVGLRKGKFRDISGELSRCRENAIRIALCLWVGDKAEGELTAEQAERAVRIERWCLYSYMQILKGSRYEKKMEKVDELSSLVIQTGGQITLRDLKRRHGIEEKEVEALAREFPERFKVETHKPDIGRPSRVLRNMHRK